MLIGIIGFGILGYKTISASGNSIYENASTEVPDIDLPIIMYHSVLKDPNRAGKFVVSPQQFESDITYLQEQGYTPILVKDLIDYVEKDQPLPPKPIMITFDDGYYNNYHYIFPILKKYQTKVVISPICYQTELFSQRNEPNPNYAHLTWDNLGEMVDSGLVEIQNHSYNLHETKNRKGAKIAQGEDKNTYEEIFTADTQKSQALFKEHLKIEPTTYTYPYGAYCQESEEIIKKMGFKASFITCDKNNLITKNPDCLYKLNRYNRPAGMSTAEFMQRIIPKTNTTQ